MKSLFTKIVFFSAIVLFVFSPLVNSIGILDNKSFVGVEEVYAQSPGNATEEGGLPNPCLLFSASTLITVGGDFIACNLGVLFVRVIWYGGTQAIAALVGGAFDFFLFYTSRSSTYSNVDFILVGWGIVRDLSNVVLIAGLLYIAISMMLDNKFGNWKKMLMSLIIAAFFVNFSLFLTQIIVDASHILSRVFYNAITVSSDRAEKARFMGEKYLPLSEVLLNKMTPQRLVTGEVKDKTGESKVYYFTVYIIAGLINIIIIGVFASITFLMIGRTIQLIFSMILSPFAVVSTLFPSKLGNKDTAGWSKWFSDLVSTAFMLPVFMFFMYLIVLFINLGEDARKADVIANTNLDGIEIIINIVIPVLFILGLMHAAKTAAKKMASNMTNQVVNYVEKGTKWTLGTAAAVAITGAAVATGGATAAVGSSLAKGGAQNLKSGREALVGAGDDLVKRAAAQKLINTGRRQMNTGKMLQRIEKRRFDVRNWNIGGYGLNTIAKKADIDISMFTSKDSNTIESRAKALKEKKTARMQQNLDDALDGSGVKSEIDKRLKEVERKQKIVNQKMKDFEYEFEEGFQKKIRNGVFSDKSKKQIAEIKSLEKQQGLDELNKEMIDDYGVSSTFEDFKESIKSQKNEIKGFQKEMFDVASSVLDVSAEGMKGAFAGLGTTIRKAMEQGISSVEFNDLNLGKKFTGYDPKLVDSIAKKIKDSLKS